MRRCQGQKTVLTGTLCVRLIRKRGGDGVGPATSPSHSLADRGSVRHVTVISATVRFVGTSYCVVTPETYHLPTTNPSMACTASWLPYHPMYIPIFPHPHPPPQHQPQPSLRAPTRSISCQVTHIEDKLSSEGSQRPPKPRLRSHSVRACRGKDKAAVFGDDTTLDLKRASSIKYKAEKAKAITKDLNLKSSNINQEKEKGEKISLFSKIFGRKKKKHTDAGTATSTSSGGGNQSTEVEYATFSAQFPPPEWVWYQQQLERQKRTEEWVSQQVLKSANWQQFGLPVSSSVDSGTLSKARTESLHNQLHHAANAYNPAKSHIYATLSTIGPGQSVATDGGFRGMSEGSGVAARALSDKRREEETNMKQTNYATVSNAKKGHSHGHHHRHHHGYHKQKEHRKAHHENNYDVPASNLPAQGIAPSNVRVDDMEEITFIVLLVPFNRLVPFPGTPPHTTMCLHHKWTTKVADSGKLFANTGHRRSHRPRQRGHKAYSYYDTTVGTDISIEYKGRLPKKNSQVAQSRDSGVNFCAERDTIHFNGAEKSRGCSEHHPIINVISASIDNTGSTGVARYTTENSFGAEDPAGRHLEDRLECEGYSQDAMPSYVAVSYCDSSIGEEGAGEVVLCQAEINHRQVPQLVLDTEHRGDRGTLAEEPDVALSNAGSKDTLERTAGESEHSLQTVVVHSPNCSDVGSKTSSKTTGCGGSRTLSQDSHDRTDGKGKVQEVTRLGGELQELGVVDSGFNSPRNSDDKENQQHQTLGLPQMGNNQRHGQHGAKQLHQQAVSPQEEIPAPEHKSKHERIKAFVKQSNQMLEQRQINSLPGAHSHVSDLYSNYAGHGQPSTHLHLNQHYNSLPKPLHPIQHHHVQQQQLQLQPPQPASLNNQRHHHHHHHHGRPHSLHGTTYERPRSQGVWVAGEGSPPNDLHTFQQQQLNGKKFGLNGEFEVVGVV
ncbi:hypothetical protein C0Q70_00495 [Pomacea canaliculata]|uniref:Uncharacterized protein n=1 Tax=Pomacea canaliculata TaxID=400727 RepID=A0A2T7PWT9_POMCA|nr:hypothetical protein C0Q70_00495 [Pomacea canaliculata]